MKFETLRTAALALPDTTEEPHHDWGSFRVRGRIFVTVPPGREFVHLFLDEQDRELALAAFPEFTEKVLWGGKVVGLRVMLAEADTAAVKGMVRQAHGHKASKPAPRSGSRKPGPATAS